MDEKFVIYFGFPSTDTMLQNVEKFASNTDQSLEDAWVDLIHTFMRRFKISDDGGQFISDLFSEVYEMQVISPPHEQQKYPEILGKTKFRLPAISFRGEYVTCKETGEKIKIKDEDLELLCKRLEFWIDVKDVSYAWL